MICCPQFADGKILVSLVKIQFKLEEEKTQQIYNMLPTRHQHNRCLSTILRAQFLILCWLVLQVACQLPDDIQRELNQNLAEQARIQAMREQHKNQLQSRAAGPAQQARPQQHDPNNYSYQQVSPPIQYSYYQPYGDAAKPQTGQSVAGGGQPAASVAQGPPMNLDLNNLNFDLPSQPAQQAAQPRSSGRQQQQHYTPSFTGVGGLPVLQPVGGANAASNSADSYAPAGQAPLAPQAQVQQGPPLTEADFKDITGGENYGAPGGNDFGLGEAANTRNGDNSANTDAQLREFGLPAEQPSAAARRSSAPQTSVPDFGTFGGNDFGQASGNQRPARASTADNNGLDFEGLENLAGGGATPRSGSGRQDFDFASQPSSANGDQIATAGGAPGSLQSLLGAGFPGLGGGSSNLDGFAGAGNNPQRPTRQQPLDDRALDIADLGEKSDQFSGADLGGFEQPSARNDQDFNYAAAASQQPSVVPYPDGNPQPVGTLWALSQPQALTQARYNPLPDKGTYIGYPAYEAASEAASVSEVVDRTPRARRPGPGRYSMPSPSELAPEHRLGSPSEQYDYTRAPVSRGVEAESSDSYDDEDLD